MFYKGDRVQLKKDSEFYGQEWQIPVSGGICNGDNGHGKFHVVWGSQGYNLYAPGELELMPKIEVPKVLESSEAPIKIKKKKVK